MGKYCRNTNPADSEIWSLIQSRGTNSEPDGSGYVRRAAKDGTLPTTSHLHSLGAHSQSFQRTKLCHASDNGHAPQHVCHAQGEVQDVRSLLYSVSKGTASNCAGRNTTVVVRNACSIQKLKFKKIIYTMHRINYSIP